MRRPERTPTVAVLGGAGAMGRITVRDLFETARGVGILVADVDGRKAVSLARSYRSKRVRPARVDVRDPRATARLLREADVVVNACQHDFNLSVMRAALEAGTHYLDLGGLFHVTREQLKLHPSFRRAGLLALLGIGAAPGTTNLLARLAADELEAVHEIHCYVASASPVSRKRSGGLVASYSIQTILEEASLPAALFTRGRFRFVEPLGEEQAVRFPPPVGQQHPACTIHSEVATLPLSYRAKGVREVSFRIAFGADQAERLRFLRASGLLSADPLPVGAARVAPRDVVVAALRRLPKPPPPRKPARGHEILRVVVRGEAEGRPVEEVLDCHVTGIPAWGLGLDADTGCPPSVCAQLLLQGGITARGVLPPERAVPARPFFDALAERGMRVRRRRRSHSVGRRRRRA